MKFTLKRRFDSGVEAFLLRNPKLKAVDLIYVGPFFLRVVIDQCPCLFLEIRKQNQTQKLDALYNEEILMWSKSWPMS